MSAALLAAGLRGIIGRDERYETKQKYLTIGKDRAMLGMVQVGDIDALAPHPLQGSISVHLMEKAR